MSQAPPTPTPPHHSLVERCYIPRIAALLTWTLTYILTLRWLSPLKGYRVEYFQNKTRAAIQLLAKPYYIHLVFCLDAWHCKKICMDMYGCPFNLNKRCDELFFFLNGSLAQMVQTCSFTVLVKNNITLLPLDVVHWFRATAICSESTVPGVTVNVTVTQQSPALCVHMTAISFRVLSVWGHRLLEMCWHGYRKVCGLFFKSFSMYTSLKSKGLCVPAELGTFWYSVHYLHWGYSLSFLLSSVQIVAQLYAI